MIEKLLAGATLVLCIGLLVRLVLPPVRRQRLDTGVRRAARKLSALLTRPYRAWRLRRDARRMTEAAIRRASGRSGEWTGNVYRPKSFQKRSPKDVERPSKER